MPSQHTPEPWVDQIAQLRSKVADLQEELDAITAVYESVMREACAGGITYETDDRLHCTCVPHLREGIANTLHLLQSWWDRTQRAYLSNDHPDEDEIQWFRTIVAADPILRETARLLNSINPDRARFGNIE